MNIRAKGWEEFQHYKDRSPIWIKLHRKLLDDRVFHRLPDASRALAPMLWLLASESKEGTITDAVAEISFRLRMTEKKVEEALNPLIEAGFFLVEQVASTPLAEPEQVASLEKRREREEEEERAFAAFVASASKHNWPKPQSLNTDRRKKLRARLAEHGFEAWETMLSKAGASDFLCSKFALKLDWVLEPKNFTKVIEGNYDARGTEPAPKPRFGEQPATINNDDPSLWAARMRGWRQTRFWVTTSDWGPPPGDPGCLVPPALLEKAA